MKTYIAVAIEYKHGEGNTGGDFAYIGKGVGDDDLSTHGAIKE